MTGTDEPLLQQACNALDEAAVNFQSAMAEADRSPQRCAAFLRTAAQHALAAADLIDTLEPA